jgi:hypothetical protein
MMNNHDITDSLIKAGADLNIKASIIFNQYTTFCVLNLKLS